MLILIPEGRIADQEYIKNNTACPNVNRFAVGLLLENLGAEIAGRAGKAIPGRLLAHDLDGQAEISQFDVCTFVFARQQQILGLQVSVHDEAFVAVAHRVQDLLYTVAGVYLAVKFTCYDVLE